MCTTIADEEFTNNHMIETSAARPDEKRLIRELVEQIELTRLKRREQWRGRTHPKGKRFTQEEICDGPCPTYRNLLTARSQRLPSRLTVEQIADYLECSLEERNALLTAAQYAKVPLLEGQVLQNALGLATLLVQTLPYPAKVVDEHGRLVNANTHFARLFDIQHNQDRIPLAWLTLSHFMFNPEAPFNRLMRSSAKIWQHNARQKINTIRRWGDAFRYETWYGQLIEDAKHLPQFSEHWNHPTANESDKPEDSLIVASSLTHEPMHLREFRILLSDLPLPQVMIFLPANEAAVFVYQAVGASVDTSQLDDRKYNYSRPFRADSR